ncbi:MAG TPA: hypothetical protein VLL25_16840, partial [Acidimicrobiales bacterium]|nr:hypothetical protein [Acidimicrobiales bacterium]
TVVDSGMGGGRRSNRGRAVRPAVIAALAVGVLTIVGVSVSAAQSSGPAASPSSTTTPTTAPNSGLPRQGFRGHGYGPGGLGGLAGFGGVIHGEYVRPNGTGYQTVDVQVGQVTAVSSSSITLKSVDEFTKTYSVDTNTLVNAGRDGIGSVKVNDKASVQAVVKGKTAAAVNIIDSTTLGALRQHWRPVAPPSTSTPSTTTP